MKLKYFLALILSCSDMAGASFHDMFQAIEACDLETFEREMKYIPDTYEEYVGYVERYREYEGINSEEKFSERHLWGLETAFKKIRSVDFEYFLRRGPDEEEKLRMVTAFEEERSKKKENLSKMLIALSKKVLKGPFREFCESCLLQNVVQHPGVFSSFRRDPDLNQFIKNNANVLYLNAMINGSPGVLSTLRNKYGALLPADNAEYPVAKTDAIGFGDINIRVFESFLRAFSPDRTPTLTGRYTQEDLEGLCEEFVFLYEDFIKGVGRRTRSLQDESQVEGILESFLNIPLKKLLMCTKESTIESEDFLQITFPDNSPKKSKDSLQKNKEKGVAERFGGLSLRILFEYLGYPEEPHLYTVPLQRMADTLKEMHFDLFKRCSEKSLGELKSKVDFLNNLVLEKDANLEEEVLKEKYDLCRELFFYPADKMGKVRARSLVKNFLISRQKYPDFFAMNLEELEKFYNNLSRDLQEGPGSEIEEARQPGDRKISRMEEE